VDEIDMVFCRSRQWYPELPARHEFNVNLSFFEDLSKSTDASGPVDIRGPEVEVEKTFCLNNT
jgi:hypothetical protein